MASQRGNNEGSNFKRKDERWSAQGSLNGRLIPKYAKTLARKPSNVRNYHSYVNLYILRALGRIRPQAIPPCHVRQLTMRMQHEGRGNPRSPLNLLTCPCKDWTPPRRRRSVGSARNS
jgi:hypothetical protein